MKDTNPIKKKAYCKFGFIHLIIGCSLIFSACSAVSQNSEAKNEYASEIPDLQNQHIPKITNSPVNNDVKPTNFKCDNEQINFKGVNFRCKIALISDVEASEESAIPLEDENDKPDYVQSRQILYKFNGEYAESHKESSSRPEITIYPIAEFRQACAKSKSLVEAVDKSNERLQKIIDAETVKREDIYRMTSIVGSTEILAQIKKVSFENGKGVSYITQYSPDWANIINNQQLNYIFQGITEDKKYYVYATFPIALEGLPDSHHDRKFRDYEIPDIYFDEERKPELFAAYKKYLASMENLLNNSKTNKFSPDLSKIEETLSSLKVNWKD